MLKHVCKTFFSINSSGMMDFIFGSNKRHFWITVTKQFEEKYDSLNHHCHPCYNAHQHHYHYNHGTTTTIIIIITEAAFDRVFIGGNNFKIMNVTFYEGPTKLWFAVMKINFHKKYIVKREFLDL